MNKPKAIKTIMALYGAALSILNSANTYTPTDARYCSMGHMAKLILGKTPEFISPDGINYDARKLGISESLFTSFYIGFSLTRERAAHLLRDAADAAVLRLRSNSKMNRKALLAAARYIEKFPGMFNQQSGGSCMLAIAGREAGSSVAYDREALALVLGLTYKQSKKLWYYGSKNLNGSMPYPFNRRPKAEQVKLAAARLRRMAIYGS